MVQQTNNISSLAVAPPFFCGPVTMSSREIAELVESRHADVCRTIDRLMAAGVIQGYAPTPYTHQQNGQTYHYYEINKRDSYVVVAQLSPQFTARLVDRWQELEESTGSVPQTLPEALRLAADMAEQNAQLSHKVQQDAPKVAFVNQYVEAGGAKSLRETAKILNMPEKAMIDTLLRDRVLFRQSGNLLPHALRQREGLFTVKTGTSDFGHAYTQTRVTPRGVQWIAERYASELMGG
ncbi:phage regulatory protein/antirepressor Ant [Salmonella enterica subsp. enterica serovar Alachua]|nr:phage regulatory protein/antirepressor Ant [Salmonella enterica subsp. enterica serovar Alachua]